MLMKKLTYCAALAAIFCGCTTVHRNDGAGDVLRMPVVKDVVHAKYKVGQERVEAADDIYRLFGFITWGSGASHVADHCDDHGIAGKARNGAYAIACDKAGCDDIVAARHRV